MPFGETASSCWNIVARAVPCGQCEIAGGNVRGIVHPKQCVQLSFMCMLQAETGSQGIPKCTTADIGSRSGTGIA